MRRILKNPLVGIDEPTYTRKETVEEFLARGGSITKIHANTASPVANMPMVHVDGISIPTTSGPYEYIPAFVSSETTYNASQQQMLSGEDIGLSQSWKEYEQDSIRPYKSNKRED